ncbi:Adenine deaminase [Carnimonas sp. R-84981]|uniref:adenosine deaminase n=1 Tax=Carnimonas bestiolae TaxID=3402172 RepID=UPI003EDBFF9C
MDTFLHRLPKIELHLHIEGTMQPELIFSLAERNNIALPYASIDELKAAYEFKNLQSFLDLYYQNMQVLLSEQDFYDLTWDYFSRVASEQLIHAEIFFDPQAHLARGVDIGTQLAGISRACQDAQQRYGITSAIILSFLRDMSEASALETLEAALPYREHFIGVGLDSAELGNPPSKFRRVFEKAKALGLRLVAHAGEEGPHDYISEALDDLNVERIDHGVQCITSPQLTERLAREQIPLTVCPLSNIYLKVFGTLQESTIAHMLDAGLKVTLNSDDPAYFGGYMNNNFDAVQQAFGWTPAIWEQLTRNAIEASFADDARKQQMNDILDLYLNNTSKS